jgi:hypothetical protein
VIGTLGAGAAMCAAVLCATSDASAQNTDFTFANPIIIQLPNAHYPSDLAAGDLNGNGNLDLVVPGRNNDGIVHVLLGNGNGTFGPPQSFALGVQTDHAILADFNGNGVLDLALSYRSSKGRIAVLFGNGNGTFSTEPDLYFVGRQPQSMVSGDLNGNGHIDLAVANYNSGTVRVLLNNGDGSFSIADPIYIEEYVTGLSLPHRLDVGDINGNGALDLAISNLGGGRFVILLNDGAANFIPDRAYRLPPSDGQNSSSSAVAIADMTGDGNAEIVSTMSVGLGVMDKFAVLTVEDNGILGTPNVFDSNISGLLFAMAVADFDGDGRKDVVASTGFDTQLMFFKNVSEPGSINFLNPKVYWSNVGFAFILHPMDVNNNGAIDLVYPNIAGHAIHVWLNTTPQAATGSTEKERPSRTADLVRLPEASPSQNDSSGTSDEVNLPTLLGITDDDTVHDILRKLESFGEKQ